MPKVTLDMNTFKALASDSRLDILRSLDGKKMNLKDISKATKLNKATLHEHLVKLNEAGLVKKYEREGHKWVYYKLTWKGEGLLHPENTRIVVMFSITFISLLLGIMLLVSFAQPITIGMAETIGDTTYLYEVEDEGIPLISHSYNYKFIGEIDAKEQTVENITSVFQSKAMVRNNLGDTYDEDDIEWYTSSNSQIASAQSILVSWNDSYNAVDDFENKSEESNDTDDNRTLNIGETDDFFGYSPAVPEMIATVQDPTFLYSAIVCITFFGVLFTLSSWRLWKNKKPKL